MGRTAADPRICPVCAAAKPRTAEHWYFDKRGNVTGYCKPCQRAYLRARSWSTLSEERKDKHRAAARAWIRRRNGTPPERYHAKYAGEGAA